MRPDNFLNRNDSVGGTNVLDTGNNLKRNCSIDVILKDSMDKIRTNFNNILAIALAVVIFPILWIIHGTGSVNLPSEALGATVVLETLIVQFYFRKSKSEVS